MSEMTSRQQEQVIFARNIYAIYEGIGDVQNVVALAGINLDVDAGEFISVVGPSGSGKTSLLRILGALQYPTAGMVSILGKNISRISEVDLVPFRRKTVGYVFQEGNLLPSISAFMNVVQTLRFAGVGRTDARKQATELMQQLGIKHRMNALPSRLSGGERQRASIARALANRPLLLLADEPTGSVDYDNSDSIMGLFRDLHREQNTAFIICTHSIRIAKVADRTIELRDGHFVGQHGSDLDLSNLMDSRKIKIQPDGKMNLPLELMTLTSKYGDLWDVTVEEVEQHHRIVISPSFDKIATSHGFTQCPVCDVPVDEELASCRSCGARLLE